MITRTITIVVRGENEHDLDDAFDEAVSRLRGGNTSGHDSNENGSFRFESMDTADCPKTARLIAAGYVVGARTPDVNPGIAGRFMVKDGEDADGYAIVGDSLEQLVKEAYDHLFDWQLVEEAHDHLSD